MSNAMAARTSQRPRGASTQHISDGPSRLVDTHPAERWLLLAALVVSGLLVTPETSELFNLGRATVFVLLAVGLVALVASTVVRRHTAIVPTPPVVWAAAAFVALMLVAAVRAPEPSLGLIGPYSRYTGLLPYVAYVAIFLAVLRQPAAAVRNLAAVAATVAVVVIGYGVLQALDLDPVEWTGAELITIFSTFGQANFASGYVAVVIPFLAYWLLRSDVSTALRVGAGVAIVGGVFFITETRSFQGPVALVAGLLPVAGFMARRRFRAVTPKRFAIACAGAAALAAFVFVLVAPVRDRVSAELEGGFDERLLLWEAAGEMVEEQPILGQGLGGYAAEFSRFRPAEHADRYGSLMADAPHSVPLRFLADGGALLFLAYAGFVVATAFELVRAARQRGGLLVATVGGAWIAYQVQSLVSFDVPPLASLHFLLAGAIVVLSRAPEEATATSRRGSTRGRRRRQPASDWVPPTVAAAAVALLAIPVTIPLRADIAVENADEHLGAGQTSEATAELQRATDLAPWEGQYWAHLTSVYQGIGDAPAALEAAIRAAEESPSGIQYSLGVAQLADIIGETEVAQRWFERSIERDPNNHSVWYLAGLWYQEQGRIRRAIDRIEEANRLRPGHYDEVLEDLRDTAATG